jgi:ABC-type sugar transport system ATPase subunit
VENNFLLEMKNISKSFTGVHALQNVDFNVQENEVHALMGENGAGKSTLIKILTGVYGKDSGEIILDGRTIAPQSPIEAQQQGISTIYQELNLVPYMSIAENIFIGRQPKKKNGLINWAAMENEAKALFLDKFNLNMDVHRPLEECSTAIYQLTAIARAISTKAKLVVMDEPTSSLDEHEVKILFRIIRELKANGISIIFISHRLDEIFEISDRITILRDGKMTGSMRTSETDKLDLVTRMIGKNASSILDYKKEYKEITSPVICETENIASGMKLRDLSLKIKKGEVVGLSGLLGSGRTEFARVLFGIDHRESGTICVNTKRVNYKNTRTAIEDGLAFCSEDRKAEGIFPDMSVKENLTIAILPRISKLGLLDDNRISKIVRKYIEILNIKTPSENQLVKYLSGGNQQKVLLARWLCMNPKLLILDEPTRGIDVGAKKEIEDIIRNLANEDIGVLMISSEVEELVRGCDRVAVLSEGRKAGEFLKNEITEKNLMNAMARVHERDK